MKAKTIEIGREYAVAPPNRSRWSVAEAGRATVLATGVYGKTDGGWKTEHESYVLVRDWSKRERSPSETGVSWRMEIGDHVDKKCDGYYRAKMGLEPGAAWPGKVYAVPAGWVLKPWEAFEAESKEILEGRAAAAVASSEALDALDAVAERLKGRGLGSAYTNRGRIEISKTEAEALATLLEGAGLTVEAES